MHSCWMPPMAGLGLSFWPAKGSSFLTSSLALAGALCLRAACFEGTSPEKGMAWGQPAPWQQLFRPCPLLSIAPL